MTLRLRIGIWTAGLGFFALWLWSIYNLDWSVRGLTAFLAALGIWVLALIPAALMLLAFYGDPDSPAPPDAETFHHPV